MVLGILFANYPLVQSFDSPSLQAEKFSSADSKETKGCAMAPSRPPGLNRGLDRAHMIKSFCDMCGFWMFWCLRSSPCQSGFRPGTLALSFFQVQSSTEFEVSSGNLT